MKLLIRLVHNTKTIVQQDSVKALHDIIIIYTGRSPGHPVGMAGCGHSKIARVARVVFLFVLYVAVLTSLQFLTVTLY